MTTDAASQGTTTRDAQGLPRLGLVLAFWERSGGKDPWAQACETVRAADRLGYDSVWLTESWNRDPITLLTHLAGQTSRIGLGFGVLNVFSRSPAVLANTAATLDELSGGRVMLGLGASTPNVVAGWHGLKFDKPLQRVRETIEICRLIWRRERVHYKGRIFSLEGVRLGYQPLRERIPILLASLRPKSIELCGELADGWIPTIYPLDGIAAGRARIAAGAARAGRAPEDVEVRPGATVLVTDDPSQAAQMGRFAASIYIGPPNSPYAATAAELGYAEDVERVTSVYRSGDHAGAIAAVSDRLATAFTVAGTLEQVRDRLRALRAAGADAVNVSLPSYAPEVAVPVLEKLIA
ncbi:MAG TPA: LLM class flavin-dependent oxidoreductase [Candidatus Binatia bacterium]